jgi:adenylate cyclase
MRGALPPPPGLAIVAINSETGAALGLPKAPHHWPRTVHARLVEALVEDNVRSIVFDMDFSRPKGDEDAVFAGEIAKADRVILFERLAARSLQVDTQGKDSRDWVWIEERRPPTEILKEAARAVGPFVLPKLGQQVFQFWAFKASAGDTPTTPALALQLAALPLYEEWLAVLRAAHASGLEELPQDAGGLATPADFARLMTTLRRSFRTDAELEQRVAKVLEKDFREPSLLSARVQLSALAALYSGPDSYYVNFYGPPGTLPSVPYQSLLGGQTIGRSGKTVFVGYSDTSDADQPDRYYTSFTDKRGVDLSGVEIMATAYGNLLTRRAIRARSIAQTVVPIAFFGVITAVLVWLFPAAVGLSSALVFSGCYAAFAQWQFNHADLWLPLAIPMFVQLPVALLVGLMGQDLHQRYRQKRIAQAIRNYVPETIVRDLIDREIDPLTVNRVVCGTCLATDMSGFAKLAEIKPPRELALFMNAYFDALAKVFKRANVDVMEFRADMVMCTWIGSASSANAGGALAAAIEVSETINRFAQEHEVSHLDSRVGLDRGSVYIGHSGGGGRFAYSIVGDAANTAARLESLNKQLGTRILITDRLARDASELLLRPLGRFLLSGKNEATSIVEVLGRKGDACDREDLCEQFAEALALLQRQDWHQAVRRFEDLTNRFVDDGPSKFYLARCREFSVRDPALDGQVVIRVRDK